MVWVEDGEASKRSLQPGPSSSPRRQTAACGERWPLVEEHSVAGIGETGK